MAAFRAKTKWVAVAAWLAALCAGAGRADEPKPSAVFSGLPPEVERAAGWFGRDGPAPCIVFQVRLRLAPKSPRLTTNGLGASQLSPAPGGLCPAKAAPTWASEIPLAASAEAQPMALRISDDVAREGVDVAKGRIEAFADTGELGGADLTEVRVPWLTLWPASKWFLGLVLPAFVAYWITRITEWRAALRKEKDALAIYRTIQKDKVDAVSKEAVIVLNGVRTSGTGGGKTFDDPGHQLLLSLQSNAMIENLPSWARERMVRRCEQNKIAPVIRDLIRLFPLNAGTLRAPARSAGIRVWGPF